MLYGHRPAAILAAITAVLALITVVPSASGAVRNWPTRTTAQARSAAAPSGGNVGNDPRCRYQARFVPPAASNEYLSVAGGGGRGTRVLLWPDTGGAEQVWCEEFRGGGTSVLHPSYDLNLCLDVPGGGFERGTSLDVWTCNGRLSQRFGRRYPVARSGVVTWRYIAPRNLCLDNANFNTGNVVRLWTCNGTTNQQWSATSTSPAADGYRSNGLGERIAWDAWQQLGRGCWTARAITDPIPYCTGEWCTAFSKGVWDQDGVQGTEVINGYAPSFADGFATNGVPNGIGYGTRYQTYTSTPHVGDALVWLDPQNPNQPYRVHAELVVWVDPADSRLVQTIGGNENGSKVQVRGAGEVDHGDPNAPFGSWGGGYSWKNGITNPGDGHHWVVYRSMFVRPVNT